MAASTEATVPKIDWLYPELLSKEGLVEILSQRFVKLPEDTEAATKDELLELYYRYIIPRPQRKYRLNRRGRDMTKKQVLQAKKRKITAPDNSEPQTKKIAAESSRLLGSFDGITIGNRLKPPPSCINFEKKVIKLGSSKTSDKSVSGPDSTNTTKEKTTTACVEPKIIKLNRTPSGDSKPSTSPRKTITPNKTIKLINSHLGATGKGDAKVVNQSDVKPAEQPMEMDNSESSPTKKARKIKRISWP